MKLLQEIIQQVVRFLPPADIKEARLVCQDWNLAVVSSGPIWTMVYFSSNPDRFVPAPGLSLQFIESEPRIFRHVGFNHVDKPHKFLTSLGHHDWIHSVRIISPKVETLESFAKAAYHGLLPNMEHLFIRLGDPNTQDFLNDNGRFQFPPVLLPKLKSLKIVTSADELEALQDIAFLQSLINAAPNLCSLECSDPFNLSSLAKLETLTFRRRSGNCNLTAFEAMLRSLGNSLQGLKILYGPYNSLLYGHVSWPKKQNLKWLNLGGFVELNCQLFSEMQDIFPNLTALSIPNTTLNSGSMISEILEKKQFPYLKRLKMNWCIFNEDHQTCMTRLQKFLCSNKELKVLHLHLIMDKNSWTATEECFQTCNLRVQTLILQLSHCCTLSFLVRFLDSVDLNENSEHSLLLEIRNGDKNSPFDYKATESEKGLKPFVKVMQKLLTKFKFINLKSFQNIPSKLLGKLMEDIQSNQLAVEIHFKLCNQT